jgi:hypothetical protein
VTNKLRPPTGYKWVHVTGAPLGAHLFPEKYTVSPDYRNEAICGMTASWDKGGKGLEPCLNCINRALRNGATVDSDPYKAILKKLYPHAWVS